MKTALIFGSSGLIGNHLIHQEKAKEVDMINLPAGVYNLRITFKGIIINHKIIKQ